jgi:hypothetical protein
MVIAWVAVKSGLFEHAGGWADIGRRVRVDAATMMAYSMSKTITAVAVLQLVESGRIGLDDRVERYLGSLQPYGPAVTIRQLYDRAGQSSEVHIQDNGARSIRAWVQIEDTKVTGTISLARATVNVVDGKLDGDEMIFQATTVDGDRTITLRGRVNGDEITFTPEFVLQSGGVPGGQGLFGAAGPSIIVASRLE